MRCKVSWLKNLGLTSRTMPAMRERLTGRATPEDRWWPLTPPKIVYFSSTPRLALGNFAHQTQVTTRSQPQRSVLYPDDVDP